MSHIQLGRYNQLEVVKEVDFGMYLNGDEDGEILLPKRYVPQGCKPGDVLNVFIYLDMDERLVATTLEPYVQVGEFACLEVAWVNQYGAFLDWGLMKDLFVPFREQKAKMQKGGRYLVHVHLDEESYRIVASAKIEHYLSKERPEYNQGDEAEVLVWQKTDLGFKVIVDNKYSGMLFHNEIFQPLEPGTAATTPPASATGRSRRTCGPTATSHSRRSPIMCTARDSNSVCGSSRKWSTRIPTCSARIPIGC